MNLNKQSGQILLLAIVVVGLITVNTVMITAGSQTFSQSTNYSLQSTEAINLAEAGLDKATASLNTSGGSYSGEAETVLENGSFSVNITTPTANTKLIEATGYIPSKSNPKVKRTVKITASKGLGFSFNYGLQVGEGGLQMDNNSQVNGSVYSNGNIVMSNNTNITGDAYVAGGTAPTADQESDCIAPNCTDYLFGKKINSEDRLDITQSFKLSQNNTLNKISLKLKKIGTPPDLIVKIVADNNGSPNKSSVLASGTLLATLVANQYSFVDVTFSSSPALTKDTTYWILLDTSSNTSYWSWSADSIQGYNRGGAKWSSNWQAQNPVWEGITSDLGFKVYIGGVITSIAGSSGSVIGGNAYANTLTNLSVSKGAYYQTKQNVTANSFHPGSVDPPTKVMSISDGNIQDWKDQATIGGVYNGDINGCVSKLGPGKYVGNISLNNNCAVVIKDPVWVTGTFNIANNVTLKLDNSYGSSSGVILIDKQATISNGSKIIGNGVSGSILILVSTFDSRINGQTAIDVSNGGNEGVLYAPIGIIDVLNGNNLKELAAWKIQLSENVIVNYDTGLSSAWFSSGPSGSFSIIRGTYQLK